MRALQIVPRTFGLRLTSHFRFPMNSFEQLFESVRPRLLGLALALTGDDREAAEDLVQECALRAFRKFDRYLELQPFEPWVRRVLVRVHLDAAEREETVSLDALMKDGFDVEDPSSPSEECFALLDAVAALPPSHQVVVFSVVEGGDWSTSAARMRRRRVLAALAERLGVS